MIDDVTQVRTPPRKNGRCEPDNMTEETNVESRESGRPQSLPFVNYGSAIAKAIEWLGDRYHLAKPKERAHYRRSTSGFPNGPAALDRSMIRSMR
jgi:hypothetical protein